MAVNLVRAGHEVSGFDLDGKNLAALVDAGALGASSAREAVRGARFVVTMLPAGEQVRNVLSGSGGVLAAMEEDALLIDCSTIDVATARQMADEAARAEAGMVDAPVSGGIMGARQGTLTFMCGGTLKDFQRAEPLLADMGKTIVHAGDAGAGQAAKACNNMLLAISMIGVCEAFNLADSLGLDRQKLFDISSTASGQCWSLNTYCPVPGPVPSSPANTDYRPGFSAAMMLKDLRLSQHAARDGGITTPLGRQAMKLYEAFAEAGNGDVDFSGIIRFLREGSGPPDDPADR